MPIVTRAFCAAALALALGGPARAQMPTHDGAVHPEATSTQGQDRQEMMAAMERMNRDMMAPGAATGDPDRDMVAMMIPHHQGAIEMARIYLRTGRDPDIRRMARKIIADQQREIGAMRAWQARHPAPAR